MPSEIMHQVLHKKKVSLLMTLSSMPHPVFIAPTKTFARRCLNELLAEGYVIRANLVGLPAHWSISDQGRAYLTVYHGQTCP